MYCFIIEGWFGWLLWHCWYTIHNIPIHFIIIINKRTRLFIKHFNYCSSLFQGIFPRVSFVFWWARWLFSSFWVAGHVWVNWKAVLTKTTQSWKSLRADPLENTHNITGSIKEIIDAEHFQFIFKLETIKMPGKMPRCYHRLFIYIIFRCKPYKEYISPSVRWIIASRHFISLLYPITE